MKTWKVTFEVSIEYEKEKPPTKKDVMDYIRNMHKDLDRAEIEWVQTEETS